MNARDLANAVNKVTVKIESNVELLTKLDQQSGDGDLGISMKEGFRAVNMVMDISEEKNLGKLLIKCGNAFNEAAPSSLGTILSFGFMGMAHKLKGIEEASNKQVAEAMRQGIIKIMEKAGSRPGERTILDALCPAVDAFEKVIEEKEDDLKTALEKAAKAAKYGTESTKSMLPVHGRAAYYGEKNLGYEDGGAVVGRLIFEALYEDISQ